MLMKTLKKQDARNKSLNVIRIYKKDYSRKKDQLIKMVLDIEKYPEFVPWCLSGKVHSRKESKDLVEIKADLKVGKRS